MMDEAAYAGENIRAGRMLGLARKAGKLAAGTEHVTDAVRSRRAVIVLPANDISDNTVKRIRDCCAFYKAEILDCAMTMSELSSYIGLTGNTAAVAVTDKNFAAAIRKLIKPDNAENAALDTRENARHE